MDIPSVVWFGKQFKKDDGKQFRDTLVNTENYVSTNLYIKNDRLIKGYVEQRNLVQKRNKIDLFCKFTLRIKGRAEFL